MSELGDLLIKLRGKESLRDAAKRAGISHTYLSIVEKGVDLRSGSPVKPTPETLKSLSKAYNYEYEELMRVAGYIDELKKEQDEYPLPESQYDWIVKEAEEEFGVSLRDDPVVEGAVRELVRRLAEMKKK